MLLVLDAAEVASPATMSWVQGVKSAKQATLAGRGVHAPRHGGLRESNERAAPPCIEERARMASIHLI